MSSTAPVTKYPSITEEFSWSVDGWRGSPQYARFLLGDTNEVIHSPSIVSKGGFLWKWEILLCKQEAKENLAEEVVEGRKAKKAQAVENEVIFRCVSEKWPYFMNVLRVEGSWKVKRQSNTEQQQIHSATKPQHPYTRTPQLGYQIGCEISATTVSSKDFAHCKVDGSMSPGHAFESSGVRISTVSNNLNFTANFTISGWEATTTPKPCPDEEPPTLSLLEEFHDLTIEVGGQKFVAHKAVLASRSRVFRTMLKADMLEKQENQIVLTDVSGPAWRQFQNFLYSNRTNFPNDWDLSFLVEMLMLSDKYEVPSLKKVTEEVIVCRLTRENVFEILRQVEKFNLTRVVETASIIILKNWDAMKTDEKFAAFVSFGSDVAKALMLKLQPEQS